jgi:hypothetical protein
MDAMNQPPREDEVKARLLPGDSGLHFVCVLPPHLQDVIRTHRAYPILVKLVCVALLHDLIEWPWWLIHKSLARESPSVTPFSASIE